MAQTFEVDPDNFLGFQHDEYKNACYALAISKPEEYYKMRSEVHSSIKREALKDLYATFYHVLSSGTKKDGTTKIVNTPVPPNYPAQKASDLALDACATLMPVVERVIDILLPMHGTEVAQKRLAEVSLGRN